MRGLDRWIEGDTPHGPSHEWRSRREPMPATEPEPVGEIAQEYREMTAAELLTRLRAVLKGVKL